MKILIADDDAGYRYPLRTLFEDAGYEVVEAEDRLQIEELAGQCDIWLIDVRLPSGAAAGVSAIAALAARGVTSRYAVLFMSALPESFVETKLRKLADAGVAWSFVEKSEDRASVLDLVRETTQKTHGLTGTATP